MKINFNNVRRQAMIACDSLTEKLNRAILTEVQYAKPNNVHHGQDIPITGYVLIDAEEIQEDMDELRQLIATIGMTYQPGDGDFKNVYEELYPNEGDGMKYFNDQDEEG